MKNFISLKLILLLCSTLEAQNLTPSDYNKTLADINYYAEQIVNLENYNPDLEPQNVKQDHIIESSKNSCDPSNVSTNAVTYPEAPGSLSPLYNMWFAASSKNTVTGFRVFISGSYCYRKTLSGDLTHHKSVLLYAGEAGKGGALIATVPLSRQVMSTFYKTDYKDYVSLAKSECYQWDSSGNFAFSYDLTDAALKHPGKRIYAYAKFTKGGVDQNAILQGSGRCTVPSNISYTRDVVLQDYKSRSRLLVQKIINHNRYSSCGQILGDGALELEGNYSFWENTNKLNPNPEYCNPKNILAAISVASGLVTWIP